MVSNLDSADLTTILNALLEYEEQSGCDTSLEQDKIHALRDSIYAFGGVVTVITVKPAWLDKKLGVWHPESIVESRLDGEAGDGSELLKQYLKEIREKNTFTLTEEEYDG